jgi:hypothetical protein
MPQHVSPQTLVGLKRRTNTTLSYASLAKRAVLLRLADEKAFENVRWGALEQRAGREK